MGLARRKTQFSSMKLTVRNTRLWSVLTSLPQTLSQSSDTPTSHPHPHTHIHACKHKHTHTHRTLTRHPHTPAARTASKKCLFSTPPTEYVANRQRSLHCVRAVAVATASANTRRVERRMLMFPADEIESSKSWGESTRSSSCSENTVVQVMGSGW
jgi:hypothetical protein